MKILHVASFVGNIGDNASHKGLDSDLIRLIDDMLCKENEFLNFRVKSLKEASKKVYSSVFKDLKLIN